MPDSPPEAWRHRRRGGTGGVATAWSLPRYANIICFTGRAFTTSFSWRRFRGLFGALILLRSGSQRAVQGIFRLYRARFCGEEPDPPVTGASRAHFSYSARCWWRIRCRIRRRSRLSWYGTVAREARETEGTVRMDPVAHRHVSIGPVGHRLVSRRGRPRRYEAYAGNAAPAAGTRREEKPPIPGGLTAAVRNGLICWSAAVICSGLASL
jgi:hypothetical protein